MALFSASIRGSCVVGLCAAVTSALAASDAEFQRLLVNPDDPALNRQFAAVAEDRGDLRHALAALERALLADPDNPELLAEYERVRRKLLPSATAITVQGGINYASNPRLASPSSGFVEADGIVDGAVTVEDERTVAGIRLRSLAYAAAQFNFEISELSTGRASAVSGPVVRLSQDSWMHVAPGVAVSWLDGMTLYTEASVSLTAGTVFRGLTQSVTASYGWRFGGDNSLQVPDNDVLEVLGRFVVSPQAVKGDYLYLQPRFRMSNPDNGQFGVSPGSFPPDFILIDRDISPFDHMEWGGRISYFIPLDNRRYYFGVGLSVYERQYDTPVLAPIDLQVFGDQVATDEDRHDVYIEPTAHLIFPNLLAPNVDVRADYRFEKNHSNDESRDYENHVAGVRVIGRF
jgi:hypothetical protein